MNLKGKFERKIYRSESNGFTVGIIKVIECDVEVEDKITFTGYFPEIIEGDNYLMEGELIEHNKYGRQLLVKNYEKLKIETKEKLVEYLSSDLFPGIGKRVAKKIVDHFGIEAIDKILADKNNLLVLNIPIKKIDSLYENLIKYEESHNIIVYLAELGFNTKDSLKIYTKYSAKTIQYIENNIYNLIDDIEDITFPKIDKIAKRFDIKKDDTNRILSGIIYAFKEMIFASGNTYLTYEELEYASNKVLDLEISISSYLEILEMDMKILNEEEKYYLYDYLDAELNIKDFLMALTKKKKYHYKELKDRISLLEEKYNIEYNDMQKEAITKGLENNLLVITGGPGVGKTTVIRAITELYFELEGNNNITLLSPTGRAAKRLSETTNMPAMTIHRFLKWNKETDQFMLNEGNKSDAKFLIIDEVSMVDLLLFDNLLKALKSNVRIILVGDYYQLPSVAPGQVLKDIIECEKIDVVHLNLLYRQKETSYIPVLADKIKNGDYLDIFENYDDYQFIQKNEEEILTEIVTIVKEQINLGKSYFDFQVMAPMYKGINGIDNLNKVLQEVVNKKTGKFELKVFDHIFRENDKVIQLVNVPDENIYNGDIGIVEHVVSESISESGKNELYVNFDGNLVRYLPNDFNMLKHAYAISIHKSQGNEFETVIIPVSPSFKRMLYRKLIYTGITRAKNKLYLVGIKEAFIYSIKNNSESHRRSTLKERLGEYESIS